MIYRVAEANEALIITGARAHSGKEGDIGGAAHTGFKIIVGKGAFVIPFVQKARKLGLRAHKTDVQVDCVTKQGIQVRVRGVVIYKVGDDLASIANAARRFLEAEDEMDKNVHEVFAGHVRSIVGSMTVEDIIRDRNALATQTRESSADEMQKLGLAIDSLQIQELDDPTGYIENLARPHQAAVEAEARIAAAQRDQEATQKEQAAAAIMAKSVSESQVQQADMRARAQEAEQKADQAGPLAAASAKMAVVQQETMVSELEASRREQELQVEIVKPAQAARDATIAEAEAERQRVVLGAQAEAEATSLRAKADAEATTLRGQAEANSTKANLTAEAEGLKARAEALEANKDAVIEQQIAEKLPEIVASAAGALGAVEHITVLNGAEGLGDFFQNTLKIGLGVLPTIREAFENGNGNQNGHKIDKAEPERERDQILA